ncbi:hypothetical protein D934_12775 [Xylella fastidiosa subsp. sandyi Ann-1]|uniref:Uncharacterized protein n=1 Tax=Xylella fastidiosa subsp. sandyi Ann-1 TaxID=155920 RepID=A0A060HCR1_XYLFS|nr:hypothetical protein D934_00860 [Xylella fastidiosa subsp. sandyi Ann-1]AIC11176.1 hypothetical protein D934_05720 [Xylella fastidiosa subsp. sandyi Ann-1]AIC11660.1 hypothetical protein D934_12775 [Xylella fastidiosa subsp. sandyi Ann-1]
MLVVQLAINPQVGALRAVVQELAVLVAEGVGGQVKSAVSLELTGVVVEVAGVQGQGVSRAGY